MTSAAPTAPDSTSTGAVFDDDPRPLPPNRPDDDACCGSNCSPCIFDYYYEELDRYRDELRAWQARHPETAGQS